MPQKKNIVDIVKEFRFEAAHRLTNVDPGHKCGRLHGHSFRFEVRVRGEVDPEQGWVMDFGEISSVVKPIVDQKLDHNYLNDLEGLDNPTSEALCIWLWDQISPQIPGLYEITVHETCTARCIYQGPSHG